MSKIMPKIDNFYKIWYVDSQNYKSFSVLLETVVYIRKFDNNEPFPH